MNGPGKEAVPTKILAEEKCGGRKMQEHNRVKERRGLFILELLKKSFWN